MKKYFLIVVALVLTTFQSNAQDEPLILKKTIISFVPQYLIIDGIRIDVERQLKGRHFLQICPQIYTNSATEYSNYYKEMIGGGLFVYHKYFPNTDFMNNGVYLSYGITYNYFHFSPNQDFPDVGVRNINKIGADFIIGIQVFHKQIISIDFYTGAGIRNSFNNRTFNPDGSEDFPRYDHSGNLFLLGFRLGILI